MDFGDDVRGYMPRSPTDRNITSRSKGSRTLHAKHSNLVLVVICAVLGLQTVSAQSRPQLSNAVRAYVSIDAPVVALTHVRVIDGTGAPPREDQTLIIRDSNIAAIGNSATTVVPDGATTIDLTGKSVIPGLVMVHEHLYYPNGPGVYGQLGESFSRLYLSGGVTTMRTGGNVNGFMDLNMMRLVESGQKPGPAIDATAPYLNGPNTFIQMRTLKGPEDARRQVQYWTDEGATSLKTYMQITRGELAAAINEAHRRGIKVTGHLCSVTYAEAAGLGIDNLEHGFFAATDFVADKKPDQCPGQGVGQKTIAALDENGAPFKTLVQTLIKANVALTSTLTVFETFTPGRPKPPGIEVLTPQLREQFDQNYARTQQNKESIYTALFPKGMALERAFARAGGLLIAGTDPTGGGGVIPGFANQRQVELFVDAGFTPLEAISISTLNGAKYLGRDKTVGSLAAGKQADLVVINGNPAATISDIRKVETVFKQGVGYDPAKLIASVSGKAGIW
jgi:imidazolonepropionase-like amidohydrolase